jgi:hypothetical protein
LIGNTFLLDWTAVGRPIVQKKIFIEQTGGWTVNFHEDAANWLKPVASERRLTMAQRCCTNHNNISPMKKILTILCVTCALAVAAQAQETKKKHEPSPEAKALLEKYDTNKDGKLDKAEKSKMTAEDKEKWQKANHPNKKKG